MKRRGHRGTLWAWFALGLSAMLVAPAALQAQAQTATELRDHEARALFEAGRSAYGDHRYADALVEFQRAYERSRRPELLYNIGLAAMELGKDEEALAALRQFVKEVPGASNAEAARLRIELLETRLQQQDSRKVPGQAKVAEPPIASASHGRRGPLSGLRYTWVAASASVALGAVAIGLGITAQRDYENLEAECVRDGTPTCSAARVAEENLDRRAMVTNVMAAAAGAALVGAVVLYIVERPRGEASVRALLAPTGVALTGSF
jgi:tetratricopeptide (TPR) repeat protein